MILQIIDFKDNSIIDKLFLDSRKHEYTWKYYYCQYNTVLNELTNEGTLLQYKINSIARPYSFILRHTFELMLKFNLVSNGVNPPNSHDFSEILMSFPEDSIPVYVEEAIAEINVDEDGTCFRYYMDKNNKPYWIENTFEPLKALGFYNNISESDKFFLEKICCDDFENKYLKWEFTLHMLECRGLGHLRTQYDSSITILLNRIIEEKCKVNDIYLPILFLIRHSLELALKFNLERLLKALKESNEIIMEEHSLCTLFNLFRKTLLKLDFSLMDIKVYDEYHAFEKKYIELNNIIHNLDSNSRYFKYPVSISGVESKFKTNKKMLIEILELYYFTDPYITFVIDILEESGMINCQEEEW